MSTPEQNPSGQPDPHGAPHDPAAGQGPSTPPQGAPQHGATPPPGAPQPGAPAPGAPQYGATQPPGAPQYGAPQPPGAPQYGAPPSPQYPAPQYPAPPGQAQQPPGAQSANDPGKALGIVGLVLSILGCTSLIGLILSIVALLQSKKAGRSNGIAVAGIIIGAVLLLASIIGGIVFLSVGGEFVNDYLDACEGVRSGETVIWQGREVVCP